jgi:hypothetical protein
MLDYQIVLQVHEIMQKLHLDTHVVISIHTVFQKWRVTMLVIVGSEVLLTLEGLMHERELPSRGFKP